MFDPILIYLVIYIAILFIVSWFVSRRQNSEDFLIAGRNRRGWQILFSKFASSIGAAYFITYTGFAYEYGAGVFALLVGLIVGFLLFAYWAAPRIARGAREGKLYTIGQFVYSKLQNVRAQRVADIVASVILFAWLLVGIVGGAKIISDFGLLSYDISVVLTALVVLFYLLLSGYRAVILTDIIQSGVILILIFVVTFGVLKNQSLLELHTFTGQGVDIGTVIGFFLFGALSVFSYSDRYQLSYAARSEQELKHGMGLSIVPIVLIGYFLMLIGVFMAFKVPGLDSGLVFTEALKQFLNPVLVPLAVVLFFAGIMSSADTNIYAIASHYALSRPKGGVRYVKLSMVGLSIVVTIAALLLPNVVQVSVIAGAFSLLLSWAMVYIIAGGRNTNRFFGSIIGASIGFALGILYFGLEPIAAIPLILFGGLGLLYKGRKTIIEMINNEYAI